VEKEMNVSETSASEPARAKEVSILKEARELYRLRPKSAATEYLRSRADEMQEAYDLLKVSCTRTATRHFIACATLTLVAIGLIVDATPEPPLSGAGEAGNEGAINAVAKKAATG
jgi:hypothetical protein